jgi:hypothetical protein
MQKMTNMKIDEYKYVSKIPQVSVTLKKWRYHMVHETPVFNVHNTKLVANDK